LLLFFVYELRFFTPLRFVLNDTVDSSLLKAHQSLARFLILDDAMDSSLLKAHQSLARFLVLNDVMDSSFR
jgi:hypothetical protein